MDEDTLYYDGACPICSAEIGKLAKFCDAKLVVRNIHELDADETLSGREQLLARLHLKTADGQWLTGLSANIRAWEHTPIGLLWRMLDWPIIRIFSNWAYEAWLRRRNQARRPDPGV
ncbi:MAG: DUF393 domain-containing protein [Gammaproteobacteria bacterium]|nr:DUF393 domain-containing protein [Gammaproteobacteria bacterium]